MIENDDQHMATRAAEKTAAIVAIDTVLAMLEKDRKNPDQWERTCLIQALDETRRGCYRLAVEGATMAIVPPRQRSVNSVLPGGIAVEAWDLQKLRSTWRQIKGEPTQRYEDLSGFSLA